MLRWLYISVQDEQQQKALSTGRTEGGTKQKASLREIDVGGSKEKDYNIYKQYESLIRL